jgi:hypothetical protein
MIESSTAVDVVQRQVEAYNRRDLEAFAATYRDDVQIFRMPSTTPAMTGRAALREFYASRRFNLPALHAEIIQRIVVGNKVIDHERVTGVEAQPFEAVAVYEVIEGAIATVWFFYPA